MRILNIKKENDTIIRISFLGLILYKKRVWPNESIKVSLLYGLIKLFADRLFQQVQVKFLGIQILKFIFDGVNFQCYLFGKLPLLLTKPPMAYYYNIIDKLIKKYPNYKNYYLVQAGIGEFYSLGHHLTSLLNNNGIEDYIIIGNREYHKKIVGLFDKNINIVSDSSVLQMYGIPCHKLIYKNRNFITPFSAEFSKEYQNYLDENKNANCYLAIKNVLKLGDVERCIQIDDNEKILNIIKYVLNNKFIFVAPEAVSTEATGNDFFKYICKKIKDMGFEVFLNVMDLKNYIEGTYQIYLNTEEAIQLAKYSSGIITMRSGFSECLSSLKLPMFVIYNNVTPNPNLYKNFLFSNVDEVFKKMFFTNSSYLKRMLSLKHYPNVNKDLIFEYDYNAYEDKLNLADEIINKLSYLTQSG